MREASVSILYVIRVLAFPRCSAKDSSPAAPALPVVEYHRVKFNGSLDFPSEYRGLPSAEIDAAWHGITSTSMILQHGPPPKRSLFADGALYGQWTRWWYQQTWLPKSENPPALPSRLMRTRREATSLRSRCFISCIVWYVSTPFPSLACQSEQSRRKIILQNVLRMASFGDHYVGIHPTFSSPPAKLRVHIGNTPLPPTPFPYSP